MNKESVLESYTRLQATLPDSPLWRARVFRLLIDLAEWIGLEHPYQESASGLYSPYSECSNYTCDPVAQEHGILSQRARANVRESMLARMRPWDGRAGQREQSYADACWEEIEPRKAGMI